ncbi:MAG: hypothetical protein ABI661_05760, partial [Gammaproteobacteria bacterium]
REPEEPPDLGVEISGVLAGTTGSVSGYAIYDTEGSPSRVSPAIYLFAGNPYFLNVTVPGIDPITSDDLYTVVGDDGSNTPYDLLDVFSVGALHPVSASISDLFVEISWWGPISSFTGEGIPSIAQLQPLSSSFGIYQYGTLQPLLSAYVTTQFAAAVPIPGGAWLLGTGILALIGRLLRRSLR